MIEYEDEGEVRNEISWMEWIIGMDEGREGAKKESNE